MLKDPRLDPQPGDRVRANGKADREVITQHDDWVIYKNAPRPRMCSLTKWRSWCRRNKAEVVKETPDD